MIDVKWGIAPIGWRNDDIPEVGKDNTLSHVLSDIAVAGFDGTEVGGFFPEPHILNKEMELRNIEIAGKWFSSFIIRDGMGEVKEDFRKHCQYLSEVKADVAVVSEQTYSIQKTKENVFTDKPYFSNEEWEILCEGLDELGSIAAGYGLKLVYHHHMGTGVQTLEEIDRLMERTDSEYVHLLYDTGHIYVSDGDYINLLNKHINRIKHVHFKDVRQSVRQACEQDGKNFLDSFLAGMFTVPGDGSIEFTSVFEKLVTAGYQGWIVIEAEQNPDKAHPLEYALKAKKYIDNKLIPISNGS